MLPSCCRSGPGDGSAGCAARAPASGATAATRGAAAACAGACHAGATCRQCAAGTCQPELTKNIKRFD